MSPITYSDHSSSDRISADIKCRINVVLENAKQPAPTLFMAKRHDLFLTLWHNAINKTLIVQKSDRLQGAAGRLKLINTRRREARKTGEDVLGHVLFFAA